MDKTINPLDFQPLKERVYEAIKERIINLTFKPGAQLMEKRLADDLGVSASPVRDAFQRLEKDGLVCTIPYRGCYVAPLTEKEFREIFQLREALELYCLERSLGSYHDEDIMQFRQIIASVKKQVENGNETEAFLSQMELHKRIVKKLGNESIEEIYATLLNKFLRYVNVFKAYQTKAIKTIYPQHFNILKAIENKDIPGAVTELKKHLIYALEGYLESDMTSEFFGGPSKAA